MLSCFWFQGQGLKGFFGYSVIKKPPAMQEIRVQSLGWKDPLENKMSTNSSLLVWETPWIEQHGGLQSMGSQKSKT